MHTQSRFWQGAFLRWLYSTRAYPDHQLYRTTCNDGWGDRWSCKTPPCGGKLSSEGRSPELWVKCWILVDVGTPIWRLQCAPCWEPGPQDFRTVLWTFTFLGLVVWVGSEVWYLRCTLRILQENKPDGSSDAFLWMCKALHDQHGRVVRRSLKDAAILASCHHVVQELDTVWRIPHMAKRAEPFVRLCTKLVVLTDSHLQKDRKAKHHQISRDSPSVTFSVTFWTRRTRSYLFRDDCLSCGHFAGSAFCWRICDTSPGMKPPEMGH